jgi:hypothetical protein
MEEIHKLEQDIKNNQANLATKKSEVAEEIRRKYHILWGSKQLQAILVMLLILLATASSLQKKLLKVIVANLATIQMIMLVGTTNLPLLIQQMCL